METEKVYPSLQIPYSKILIQGSYLSYFIILVYDVTF